MNRTIKFRYWDDELKTMIYSREFQPSNEDIGNYDIYQIIEFLNTLSYEGDNALKKIQQYTGQDDKNGVEIYEKDVIRLADGHIYTVEFMAENNMIDISGYMFSSFGCEVLGNVYEPPTEEQLKPPTPPEKPKDSKFPIESPGVGIYEVD